VQRALCGINILAEQYNMKISKNKIKLTGFTGS
jgi:hypothetical protein